MKRPLVGALIGAILGAIVVLVALAAQAQDVDLPIDTIYRGDPGDLIHVATIPAKPGLDCTAILESRNNESVHPNSDILVGPVTFTNVETATFQAAGLTFVSTGPINVAVRIGDDRVFSAGFTLEVTCNPPTTTTIPAEPSTTTTTATSGTTPSTSLVTTTTLSEPPVGGVDTGGGACADGSCSSLSPLMTWVLMGAMFVLSVGLAGALTIAVWRSDG